MITQELDVLTELDMDLINLWQTFEKEAMTGVLRVCDASLTALTFPSIFGFPDIVYYFNGIILFQLQKGHVRIFV